MYVRSILLFPFLFSTVFVMAAQSEEVPPIPEGYSSEIILKAAYALGSLKLIDVENVSIPEGILEEKGIEYNKIGEKSLQLDIYYPENPSAKAPAILFLHGGSWKGGQREIMKFYCIRFAEMGYVTATASYRLTKEAPFPAAVQDVKCAVKWLKKHAEKYSIDSTMIAVSGNSAGGHLSMMIGYTSDCKELDGDCSVDDVDSRVQAVVNFYGPTDLTAPIGQASQAVKDFLQGKSYTDAPELYEQASPLMFVTPDDPPTLIIHGTIDSTVPIDQADMLEAQLKENNIPVVYEKYPGWPHTMDLAEPVNKRAVYAMTHFFNEHLPLPKK